MRLLPFLLCLLVCPAFSQSYTVGTSSPLLADLAEVIGGDLIQVRLLSTSAAVDTFDLYLTEKSEHQGTSEEVVITEKAIWISPTVSILAVDKIAAALQQMDSLNAERYQFNADVYRQQLLDLEKNIQEQVDALSPTQRLVVSASEEMEAFATQFALVYETATAQTDLDRMLCQKLADCPAGNHYELLENNADAIIAYLQENMEADTRNPTGWNNYWLLGGLVLLGLGIGLFAFMRKK